jgi:hypothetical protein
MRRRLFAIWIVPVALLGPMLAGCGSQAPPRPHHPPALAALSGRTASANRSATRKEAARLLRLAPVPRGARPTTRRGDLTGPALGTPGTSSLIDLRRIWHVDRPFSSVAAWLQSQDPDHLKQSGTSSSSGPGSRSAGVGWSAPDRVFGTEFTLEVGLSPDRAQGGSILRADGMGIWLDPRPIRVDGHGRRVHVSVAEGCPANDDTTLVGSSGRDLWTRLLPAGKPTGGLVCVFDGMNHQPHQGLLRSIRLTAGAASRFASRVARLPLSHDAGEGVHSCPMDDGSEDLVALHYAGRPDVDLHLHVRGCESIDNGRILVDRMPSLPAAWRSPIS